MQLLCFSLDDHRYGITSSAVVEIIRAVAITPLPGSNPVVAGVIDVRGTVVPVFDMRARFGVPTRDVIPADCFVLVRTPSRVAALHVDHVDELIDVDEQAVLNVSPDAFKTQVPTARHVVGAVTLADGLVLIHDPAEFLSSAEGESLDAALASRDVPSGALN